MKTILAQKFVPAAILAALTLSPVIIPEATARATVSVGANIGIQLPRGAVSISVGDQRYHYHDGHYYKKSQRGYVPVRAPRGAAIRSLPPGYNRVIIGGRTYYRHGTVYYIKSSDRYIVVDKPDVIVVEKDSSTVTAEEMVSESAKPYSVWVDGERELVMKNGQFFRNSPQGLVWVALPVGATARELPIDSTSVWYQEIEYFEKDGVHFQKTPDGYRIITPPWKSE